jgi:cytochrome c oxidase assembly factor 2
MPSHLHPRSRLTMSLFTTTLLASFFVVGLPHLLPCPSGPHADYADGEMMEGTGDARRRRRRRSRCDGDAEDCVGDDKFTTRRRRRRECPVPKPGGLVGEILGFTKVRDGPSPIQSPSLPPTTPSPGTDCSNNSNGWEGKRVTFTGAPIQKPGSDS